jgi:hypothetical protein
MFSLLALLSLLGIALSYDTSLHTTPHHDPSIPIYLGDIFWPPSMTLIAWLPSEIQKPLEVGVKGLTNYNAKRVPYTPALDVTPHLIAQSGLFLDLLSTCHPIHFL